LRVQKVLRMLIRYDYLLKPCIMQINERYEDMSYEQS
jgi:hypothetical protein